MAMKKPEKKKQKTKIKDDNLTVPLDINISEFGMIVTHAFRNSDGFRLCMICDIINKIADKLNTSTVEDIYHIALNKLGKPYMEIISTDYYTNEENALNLIIDRTYTLVKGRKKIRQNEHSVNKKRYKQTYNGAETIR